MLMGVFHTFFSMEHYRAVAERGRGVGFFYLTLFVLISSAIWGLSVSAKFSNWINKPSAESFWQQIPELTFEDGVLSTPLEEPYEILDPDTGEMIVIIDTTSPDVPDDMGGAKAYLSSSKIVVQKSELERREYSFSEIKEKWGVSRDKLKEWANSFASILPFILIPLFIVWGYMVRIVQITLLVVLIAIITSVRGAAVPFAGLVRLAVCALTPALLLDVLLSISPIGLPGWVGFLVGVLLLAGYGTLAGMSASKG